MDFLDPQDKSENSFGGHPLLLHIFKIKDQKQKKITKPVEIFWIDISKCYSFSETMAYFLALIVVSSTSYQQKLFTRLQMITLYIALTMIIGYNNARLYWRQ